MLLKNRSDTLPLRKNADVYVAGSNADDIGNQAGGWTLTWQGGSTNQIPAGRSPAPRSSTGIREAASRGPRDVQRGRLGADRRKQLGVVVVGETPYSEGFGDVGGPRWAFDPGDAGMPRP